MQLLLILAVVAALALSENAPPLPVEDGGLRLAIAVLGMGLIAGFAAVSSSMVALGLRYEADRRGHWLDRFSRLRAIHAGLWLAVTGAILYLLAWPQLVRFNWQLADVFLADEVLILLPVVLPMVLSWAAFYEVDKTLATANESLPLGRVRYLALHLRHELGLLLLPVLLLLAIRDAAQRFVPGLAQGELAPLLFIPTLAVIFLSFPLWLKRIWPTEPLPNGPLRARLEGVAERLGFRARDILLWKTGGRIVNAVVTGLVPRWRFVMLTDALIEELSTDELEMVFAHEVAHVRQRHLLLRVLAIMLPVVVFAAWQHTFPEAVAAQSRRLAEWGLDVPLQAPLLLVIGLGSYAMSIFGLYSRLLEHQADLFACQLAGSPATFVRALDKLGWASGPKRSAASWLHPSIERRVRFVEVLDAAPALRHRFERQMRLLQGLIFGLLLASLAALGL